MPDEAMSLEEFWSLIGQTTQPTSDPAERVEMLRSALNSLDLGKIVAFEMTFRRLLNEAYVWDLWGAAWLINGESSSDGFEYFRRWLVSRGRATYEAALLNPDSLASVTKSAVGPENYWEFEEIYYVARDVFEAKGGEGDVRDKSEDEAGLSGDEPHGDPFDADKAKLAKRYPDLWKRFGEHPLPWCA